MSIMSLIACVNVCECVCVCVQLEALTYRQGVIISLRVGSEVIIQVESIPRIRFQRKDGTRICPVERARSERVGRDVTQQRDSGDGQRFGLVSGIS